MIDDRKVDTLWGLDKKPAQLVHDERICQCCDAITATYGLTPREHEIIVMLAHNRTVSDIAGDLIISVRTVNTHMNNIYRKLDIPLAQRAIRSAEIHARRRAVAEREQRPMLQ